MIADLPPLLIVVFGVLLGFALGSFTTCVVYRIPRGLSIWRNDKASAAYRSFCPQCRSVLTARDLLPVLSWLMLRGRCRHCGNPIGVSYVVIEIAVVIMTVIIVGHYGISITAIILCAMLPVLAGLWSFFVLKPRP